MNRRVDVAVIGAGHAGLSAIREVRQSNKRFVLINGGGPGTTCARIGCVPSRVALHLAEVGNGRRAADWLGRTGGASWEVDPTAVLDHMRVLHDSYVDSALTGSVDALGDALIADYARFIGPNTLRADGQTIEAAAIVIATGAHSVVPADWQARLGDRVLTIETLFEQDQLPAAVAVVGLGPIGLEMSQALHRLGVRVIGIDAGDRVAHLPDPIVNQAAVAILRNAFPIWLGARATAERSGDKVLVRAGPNQVLVDRVFIATGRHPNLDRLGLNMAGCATDSRGVPIHHPATLRVGRLPIYVAGDAGGTPANLQLAAEQGRVAGYNASHHTPITLRAKTPMSIVFSEPSIAWVGPDWSALDHNQVLVGQLRFGPPGQPMSRGPQSALLRVYADRHDGCVIGGAMVGPGSEHLAHLLAWGAQQRLTVHQMLEMPFYHPVVEEVLQDALKELARRIPPIRSRASTLGRLITWRGRAAYAA